MDDLALFADGRQRLLDARDTIREWLWRERGPRLKDPDAAPRPTAQATTFAPGGSVLA